MAQSSIDLGTLHLVSSCSGLEAHSSCRARIASSGGHLTATALTTDAAHRPWITRGKDYHYVVILSFPDGTDEVEKTRLTGFLAKALFETTLWQQLGVRASSRQISSNGTSSRHEFAISLEYNNDCIAIQKQHKLREGVPLHDIQLPEAVRIAQLEQVCLDVQFSRSPSNKRQRLRPAHSELALPGSASTVEQIDYEDELLELSSNEQDNNPQMAWNSETSMPFRSHTPVDQTISSPSGQRCVSGPETSRSAESSRPSSPCLKRSSSTAGDGSNHFNTPWPGEYLDLLVEALVNAIHKPVTRSRNGITIISHESPKYLADCFPSLWAPGCAEKVSTRAAMLPTISHAISQVCGVHAKSAALRSKLAELSRRSSPVQEGGGVDGKIAEKHLSFQPALCLRLWQTIEVDTRDRDSARRLKPVFPSDMAPSHGHLTDEDLLESPVQDKLPQSEADIQYDQYESSFEEEILELESATDLRWSRRTCTPDSLQYNADVRRFLGEREDHPAQEPTARDVHEEFVEDDLSSVCDSVGSLVLAEHMAVAEEHQILSCDLDGTVRIWNTDPCTSMQPVVTEMDVMDEMLV